MTEKIEVFGQNSIRITDTKGRIYIDPFQMRQEPRDADYILITHDHYDHFSPEDIAKVASDRTILVVPEAMADKAQEVSGMVSKILTVKPGEKRDIEGLEVETVPAYNLLKPFHRRNAGWVGYILQAEGKRVYVAGDTDATEEAKGVKCEVALVPIGGTFTMDAKKAAELINTMQPEVAIPVHYGTVVGSPKDAETFAKYVNPPIRVEYKIAF